MRGLTRILAFVFVLLVFSFGVSIIAVAGVNAQENPLDDDNENQSEYDELDEDVTEQLGDLVVHSYEYDSENEEMVIEATWTARGTTRVTLTEMLELDSAGATQISFERLRLTEDERTEITIGVEQRSGGTAAVLLTTPQSVQNGNALVLQAGDPSSYPDISFDLVVLSIGGTAALSAAAVFLIVFRIKRDEERDKERIA